MVANAPYVPTDAVALMPPEARLHEAPVALDGGPDGLAVLRRVGAGAAGWLTPGGHLVVEAGATQVDTLCAAIDRGRPAADGAPRRRPGRHRGLARRP